SPMMGSAYPYVTFYLAIAVAGWLGGLGPAVVATLLSIATAWYWYLPPEGAFKFDRLEDLVGLGTFAATGLGIAVITAGLRAARDQAQRTARDASARTAVLEQIRSQLTRERDRLQLTLNGIGDAVIV